MKIILAITMCALAAVSSFAEAEQQNFESLQKAMDTQTYLRAGIGRLTGSERAALDEFLRGYISGKQKAAASVAAAQAVDRAVKERKVQPPEVIESKIVGPFNGYGPRTFFHLANGQTWKPTNDDVVTNSPIDGPAVVILKDMFGYKMFIEGASMVRVKRTR